MRHALCFLSLTLGANLLAADPPSPAERLKAIRDKVAAAQEQYFKATNALGETKEDERKADALWKAFDRLQNDGFNAALDIAQADPKSDAGFDALDWLASTPRAYYQPAGKLAIELMTKHYAADPRVGRAVGFVSRFGLNDDKVRPHALALVRTVAETNSDRATRGQAQFGLAAFAKSRFEVAEYKDLPAADSLAAKAEAQLEAVARDYGDCRDVRLSDARLETVTLGERAAADLFELRHLRVGKTAPEIAGIDLAGTEFKLSDSRGRVTVLVFWASGCGPCMQDVPHERELVKRYQGRPFTLVGVNGDDDLAAARKAIWRTGITWRSFRDNDGKGGKSISAAYNLQGWPTSYVLDHRGVIRAKEIRGRGDELNDLLDELIQEAEAATGQR